MKQVYELKKQDAVCCCHTCISRPQFMRDGGEFRCKIIDKWMRDSLECGCVQWTEAKA